MGRNQLSKLDILRAKVWAHTCAWEAGDGEGKKASSYLLVKLANDFRQKNGSDKRLDTGFWSRCLNGEKGVSRRLVAELGNENLWPLAYAAYHTGPPIPCGSGEESYHDCAPLWAILGNQRDQLVKCWGAIRTESWVAWSPFMAELDSTGQPIDTWLGPLRSVFKSQPSLYEFFLEYMENLECLEPLFGLAVVLSRAMLCGDKQVVLAHRFSPEYLKRMEDYLSLFDVRLQDLADAALENGLRVYLELPEPEYEPGRCGIRPMPKRNDAVAGER
jgi:hypothetical protein